jgi:hypothetical protein
MAAPSSFAHLLLGYGIFTFRRGEKISIGKYFCAFNQNVTRPRLAIFAPERCLLLF